MRMETTRAADSVRATASYMNDKTKERILERLWSSAYGPVASGKHLTGEYAMIRRSFLSSVLHGVFILRFYSMDLALNNFQIGVEATPVQISPVTQCELARTAPSRSRQSFQLHSSRRSPICALERLNRVGLVPEASSSTWTISVTSYKWTTLPGS